MVREKTKIKYLLTIEKLTKVVDSVETVNQYKSCYNLLDSFLKIYIKYKTGYKEYVKLTMRLDDKFNKLKI